MMAILKGITLLKDVLTLLFNLFDTVFREMRNEEMIFTFINGNEISTKRICQYQ